MTGYPHIPSYWVDWSDSAFPKIRHKSHPDYGDEPCMSFRQARAEIIEHFRAEAEHARQQIMAADRTRIAEVKAEAEEANKE